MLNSRMLRARILQSDIAVPGVVEIAITSPGVVSNSLDFTITAISPFLCCTNPLSSVTGSNELTLVVYGDNFLSGSTARWNGSARPTRFINSRTLEATIPEADLASAGTAVVTVSNPDGSTSAGINFPIVELPPGAPTITSVSPDQFPAGGGGFVLTVIGTGFIPASIVQFNGVDKGTTFVSATELQAQILAEDVAKGSTFGVTVVNPDAGALNGNEPFGVTGNSAVVVVTNPVPIVLSFTPTSATTGQGGISMDIDGIGFVDQRSVVRWNGMGLETDVVSKSQLTAEIPDTELASMGTTVFSVSNPGPGGGSSHGQSFSITTASAAATTLFYPRLVSHSGSMSETSESTGIAIVNLDSDDAELTIRAIEGKGSESTGPDMTNPVSMTLGPSEQIPIVDSQLFGSGVSDPDAIRWMKIESTRAKTAGFFLSFNDSLELLDGADVSTDTLSSFVFPEIMSTDNESETLTKEAIADPFTQIHVANPNAGPAAITFDLYGSDGTHGADVTHTVDPNGILAISIVDLFPTANVSSSSYIRASSDKPVVPFELLGKSGLYVHGLNGQDADGGATTLYSPQYVVGGSDFRSTLTVVNLDTVGGNVSFEFIGDSGVQIGTTVIRVISPKGKIYITAQDFFLPTPDVLTEGYVRITSDGPRLVGAIVFGDQNQSEFSTALPLVSVLIDSMIFGQVASNDTYFTGAAFLNPNDMAATATIDVFDRDGNLIASTMRVIAAGRRVSLLLTQYLPELEGRIISSGYIRVTVDKGLASFALFGTIDLSVLSAVPPQLVP